MLPAPAPAACLSKSSAPPLRLTRQAHRHLNMDTHETDTESLAAGDVQGAGDDTMDEAASEHARLPSGAGSDVVELRDFCGALSSDHIREPLVLIPLSQCRALVAAARRAYRKKWPKNADFADLSTSDLSLSVREWSAVETLVKAFYDSEPIEVETGVEGAPHRALDHHRLVPAGGANGPPSVSHVIKASRDRGVQVASILRDVDQVAGHTSYVADVAKLAIEDLTAMTHALTMKLAVLNRLTRTAEDDERDRWADPLSSWDSTRNAWGDPDRDVGIGKKWFVPVNKEGNEGSE